MTAKECNGIVPENIDRIIKERGLKQGSIADKANFSKQQFSDMLNGRKIIKVCDVVAIADALGVSVGEPYAAGAADNTM